MNGEAIGSELAQCQRFSQWGAIKSKPDRAKPTDTAISPECRKSSANVIGPNKPKTSRNEPKIVSAR